MLKENNSITQQLLTKRVATNLESLPDAIVRTDNNKPYIRPHAIIENVLKKLGRPNNPTNKQYVLNNLNKTY